MSAVFMCAQIFSRKFGTAEMPMTPCPTVFACVLEVCMVILGRK